MRNPRDSVENVDLTVIVVATSLHVYHLVVIVVVATRAP